MSALEECCRTCLGCLRTYCLDTHPSPGESDLCADCWDFEHPEDAA